MLCVNARLDNQPLFEKTAEIEPMSMLTQKYLPKIDSGVCFKGLVALLNAVADHGFLFNGS